MFHWPMYTVKIIVNKRLLEYVLQKKKKSKSYNMVMWKSLFKDIYVDILNWCSKGNLGLKIKLNEKHCFIWIEEHRIE